MNQKRLIFLLSCVFFLSFMISCKTNIGKEDADDSEETIGDHEDAGDYIWDSSSVTQIVLNGSSVNVTGSGATVNDSKVTITAAGNYSISGSLTNGQVIVNSTDDGVVRLILNGINITCTTSAPIYIIDSEKTIINLVANTENYVSDGTAYITVDDEPNAAIYSKSDLTIFGPGSLIVKGNFNDGITSKDGLIIKSGTLTVSAIDDGIRGKDYLIIKDGNITVNSGGDGLKSDNEESTSKGYISIVTGVINTVSGGDAIAAQTSATITDGKFNLTSGGGSSKSKTTTSAKGIKALVSLTIKTGTFVISSADDALHSNGKIVINGGIFALSSGDDGIHADTSIEINDGTINITKSYEGIESMLITINGGDIHLISSDDGINAADGTSNSRTGGFGGQSAGNCTLNINGGNIYVDALGDGLDVNGSIVMTNGSVIVNGPTSNDNGALDYDGSFKLTGGFLLAAGSSGMTQAPGTTSTQNSILLTLKSVQSAGSLVHIQTSDGTEVFTFAPSKKYQTIVFSSPLLLQGSTYKVFTGGSSTGAVTDGLYENGTYSSGTQYANFTISSVLTKVN